MLCQEQQFKILDMISCPFTTRRSYFRFCREIIFKISSEQACLCCWYFALPFFCSKHWRRALYRGGGAGFSKLIPLMLIIYVMGSLIDERTGLGGYPCFQKEEGLSFAFQRDGWGCGQAPSGLFLYMREDMGNIIT